MIEHVLAAIEWKRREPADDLLTKLISRGGRRRRAHRGRARRPGGAALHRRPRDHRQPHRQRHVRAAPPPRPARAAPRATRALDENAIEELLRFDSPVQFSRRITLAPMPVRDVTIEPGGVRAHLPRRRRTATRSSGARPPTRSTSAARAPPSTCRSAAACTTASAPRSPGSRPGWRCPTLVRRFPELALADPGAEPAWNGRIVLRGLDRLPVTLG